MKDAVNIGLGERCDVIWEARWLGNWLLDCHFPHHSINVTTEQEGGKGLIAVINVA